MTAACSSISGFEGVLVCFVQAKISRQKMAGRNMDRVRGSIGDERRSIVGAVQVNILQGLEDAAILRV